MKLHQYACSITLMMSCWLCQPHLHERDLSVNLDVSMVSDRHAARPPDRHGSGSDVSNKGHKGAIGFNKDFPFINTRAACVKCSDRWMPRYWHWRTCMHIPGMLRHFDPLADKIMCNHCRNKYLLSPYYFQEYKAYMTEAEVECVCAESSAEYVDPAKDAAACLLRQLPHARVQEFNA